MNHVPPIPPLEEIVKRHIELALAFHRGNIKRAAATLGCSRRMIQRKRKEWRAFDAAQEGVRYLTHQQKPTTPLPSDTSSDVA